MKTIYKQGITSISSIILTSLLILSLPARASDIDIYQQAKAGSATLMFVLDTSGSMVISQVGASACDIPSGFSSSNYSSDTSTNGSSIATYSRNFCNVVVSTTTTKTYFYTRTGTKSSNYKYFKCDANATTTSQCLTTSGMIVSKPDNLGDYKDEGGNPRYYYTNTVTNTEEKFYDRLTRLKDGMFDLLFGNVDKGITRLTDDKVIGLSHYSYNKDSKAGVVVVPARALNAVVGTKTQRQLLIEAVGSFTGGGGTPTANAYAEAAAYMLGTTTLRLSGVFPVYAMYNATSGWKCQAYNTSNACTNWGSYRNSLTLPSGSENSAACTISGNSATCYSYRDPVDPDAISTYSGFNNSSTDSKNTTNYIQPTSISDQIATPASQTCSGQGIYVLTDGEPNGSSNTIAQKLMAKALGSNGSGFNCNNSLLTQVNDGNGNDGGGAWQCIGNLSQSLLTKETNPSGLKIKTAVVGFGRTFSAIPSFSKDLTQAQNIALINGATAGADQKNAARWGVYGDGGWYRGSSSQDVVDSVNKFLNALNTEIPSVTTGTATIPVDSLNMVAVQPYAYFPQFQPTPDKSYQLWVGNVKKYNVSGGKLTDKTGAAVVEPSGALVKTTTDLWAETDTSTTAGADLALIGGALSQLKLRSTTSTATDGSELIVTNRKLLTNRTISSTGVASETTTLSPVTHTYITDDATKADPLRGYLMNLLGYRVDATQPDNITAASLGAASELRQIGGLMHSSPILLTQKGKIAFTDGVASSTGRDDYVLFGSTQGLLHVVDADTGIEKFAFVPNEMVQTQHNAFADSKTTSGGVENLFYGIDGPWVAYNEYVPTGTGGELTVGSGKTISTGKKAQGKQWVYGGLRMGGNSYYGLDLSDLDSPSLKFHINPDGVASGTPLSYMGQSWSKPTVTWVKWKGVRKLVMFVGGGYDSGYESDNYDQTNGVGAGVYMFDAKNGDLLWWASNNATTKNTGTTEQAINIANMSYSVVSRIHTVDRNSDGLTDHVYFGDLGGQVWRIDLDNTLTSSATSAFAKQAYRLLNLHAATGKSPRFYDAPTFTIHDDATYGTFAVVNIGSGNRSKPLANYASNVGRKNDAVYAVYDKDVTSTKLYKSTFTAITQDLTLGTDLNVNDAAKLTKTDRLTAIPYADAAGWYYDFASNKIQDAKVMGESVAINRDLYVSVFDGSKDGLSGDCGAGVKGASTINRFCLPYSKCADNSSIADNTLSMGAGIIGVTIGSGDDPTSRKVIGGDCSGENCTILGGGKGAGVKKEHTTKPKLIPVRWYEKHPKLAGS